MFKVLFMFVCILFKIMNIILEDVGFYFVGIMDDDIFLDCGVFLIVIGNYLNVVNVMY